MLALTREAIGASWAYFGIASALLVLGAATRIRPVALLASGGALGYLIGGL
jgi:hypothetical protein